MKICLALLAVALSALDANSAFAASGTFNRTLAVSGAPAVTITTGSGYIHVHAGSNAEVRIEAKVTTQDGWSFGGSGGANDRLREILANPPIAQHGNTIAIGPSSGDSDRFRNIAIDYEITLPSSSAVKANTGSGTIQIANISMIVSAHTGSGDIQLTEVGPSADVGTGSGSIRVDGVRGAASLETGSGAIELRQEAAGDVRAQTGSGSIRLRGVNGGVRAGTGSGDLEVDGNPATEWRLNTSSGSIRLTLNPAAHFTVNASTDSGSVHVAQAISMQQSLDRQHIMGTVNGGGATLRLTTSSGDITIR
jgi:Putative adhesin